MAKVKSKLTEKILAPTELSIMVKLVCEEYSFDRWSTFRMLADLVSKEFDVKVTEDDLVELTAVGREIDDRFLMYKDYFDGDSYKYGGISTQQFDCE